MTEKKEKLIEIARSYSQKKSLPNYENMDFFASAKMEVPESEAEETSEKLFEFCKKEVAKSLEEYYEKNKEDAKNLWDAKQQEIYNRTSAQEDIKLNQGLKI